MTSRGYELTPAFTGHTVDAEAEDGAGVMDGAIIQQARSHTDDVLH